MRLSGIKLQHKTSNFCTELLITYVLFSQERMYVFVRAFFINSWCFIITAYRVFEISLMASRLILNFLFIYFLVEMCILLFVNDSSISMYVEVLLSPIVQKQRYLSEPYRVIHTVFYSTHESFLWRIIRIK